MSKQQLISPIAIDLGAKNTGVYFAHYPAGSSLDRIDKKGKVYQLDSQGYTYLMANRTAARHQRRGYDRRQMAKRLFKLIWCEYFGLEWNKDVQQTVSFLLNRRGFSFLTEEYDVDVLRQFPQEAFDELPDNLKIQQNGNGDYDFAGALTEWASEGKERVESAYLAIKAEIYLHKLYDACLKGKEYKESNRAKNKLRNTESAVYERLMALGVKGLNDAEKGSYTYKTEEEKDGRNQAVKKTATYKYQGNKYNLQAYVVYANQNQHIIQSIEEIRENGLNMSNWDFKMEDADFGDSENPVIKTHLHHLAFALHKIHDELQSGGRHRSKYFKEVKNVLENTDWEVKEKQKKKLCYLDKFCKKLQNNGFKSEKITLDPACLYHLIGHISNLELKPLSKYFNAEKHIGGDCWDESRLSEKFENWILREWRINPEKDKLKIDGATYAHKKLRSQWEGKPGTIVDFWLNTDPNWTIPPYQDNNNRRPPKCQSLLLNVGFLDNSKYTKWREWAGELKEIASVNDYLGDYEEKLKTLESGKKKRYFSKSEDYTNELKKDSGRRSMAELDARVLQFIFDRVKAEDSLNLNEIYSHAKKIKQDKHKQDDESVKAVEQAKGELEKSIEKSSLPQGLKIKPDYGRDDLFPQDSFLHLICKYYKLRQRARDGRIFIHPEYRYIKDIGYKNTGRFDDKNHLLTYCNHKPRQKRYQMLEDLAKILFTTKDDLKSKMGVNDEMEKGKDASKLFDTVEQFFNDIKHERTGLKSFMEDCAKAQKDYRGALKVMIDVTYKNYEKHQDQIRKNREENGKKPLSVAQLKSQAKKKLVEERSKSKSNKSVEKKVDRLIKLKERSLGFAKLLAGKVHVDIGNDEREAIVGKFNNPFSLAQIYNTAYKERSGNSKTCPVCSADNERRMDAKFSEEEKDFVAKASRLPAMPARVIDGAVMRMARIVSDAIAEDKWKKIERELDKGHSVHVPIITESNRFEFEPSREELVQRQRPPSKPREGDVVERNQETNIFAPKEERIKEAGKGICPYCGGQVIDESGEIDHIIPRRSQYGTLNDETNLIYTHSQCNANKGNSHYGLDNLSDPYKEAQFGTTDKGKIEQWIESKVGDGSDGNFEFGKYRSFINLAPEQQTAFRHALFLGGQLREKVVAAIDNRNRTFVNGTQRYFAEVLANKLYKLAKAKRKEKFLKFDYFGVPADGDIDSVPFVRGKVENLKDDDGNFLHPELQKHKKPEGKDKNKERQTPPSHLIDAEVAFMIALSKHYKGGSFKINAPYIAPDCYVDEYGEEQDLYDVVKVRIKESNMRKELVRVKPNENFSSHRSFTRDTYYADHYLPVLLKCENDAVTVRIGFDWKNSAQIKADSDRKHKKLLEDLVALLPVCEGAQVLAGEQYGNLSGLFNAMKRVRKFSEQLRKNGYCYLAINKRKLHEFWMEQYNTKTGKGFNGDNFAYKNLQYRTERVTISKPEDLFSRLQGSGKNANKHFTKTVEQQNITLPAKKDWENCLMTWQENEARGVSFDRFLREYFKPQTKGSHQKVRKVFSLPVLTGQGKFMVRRKSWRGGYTYQIVNDSDSRGPDNKPNISVRLSDGSLGIKLAKWVQSNSIVKFPSKEEYQDGQTIDPADWYAVDRSQVSFPYGIEQIWYRIDDSTSPSIAVKLAKSGNQLQPECLEDPICQHGFRKANARKATKGAPAQPEKSPQDVRDEFFEEKIKPAKPGEIIIYKGKVYSRAIKEAFRTATVSKLK